MTERKTIYNIYDFGKGKNIHNASVISDESRLTNKAAIFTNQAINKCIGSRGKTKKRQDANCKSHTQTPIPFVCQLLQINSFVNKNIVVQRTSSKQFSNLKNKRLTQNISCAIFEPKRPKSAIFQRNNQKQNLQIQHLQMLSGSQIIKCDSKLLINLLTLQENKNVKQKDCSDKTQISLNLFTSNVNVFMPRTKKKCYGSYIGKSRLSYVQRQIKKQDKQSKQNYIKKQQSTVSINTQKQLNHKCQVLLKLNKDVRNTYNIHNQINTNNLVKKKINLSTSHSQFLKMNTEANYQNDVNRITQQQKVVSKQNSQSHELFSSVFRQNFNQFDQNNVRMNKKYKPNLMMAKYIKSKNKCKEKKNELNKNLKDQYKIGSPSLFIQKVELQLQAKKRKEYYRPLTNNFSNDQLKAKQFNYVNKEVYRQEIGCEKQQTKIINLERNC